MTANEIGNDLESHSVRCPAPRERGPGRSCNSRGHAAPRQVALTGNTKVNTAAIPSGGGAVLIEAKDYRARPRTFGGVVPVYGWGTHATAGLYAMRSIRGETVCARPSERFARRTAPGPCRLEFDSANRGRRVQPPDRLRPRARGSHRDSSQKSKIMIGRFGDTPGGRPGGIASR